jgi:hypothetical protein
MVDESVRGQSDLTPEGAATSPRARRAFGTRVCVAPSGKGVSLTTFVSDRTVMEDSIIADGVSWPLTDAECRGSKRSEWSAIAARVYTSAEIACADQAPRKVSSLTMMTPGPRWIDIQLIEISGRKNIRIRRYEPADDRPAARMAFAESGWWTVADVKEASAKLMPETVQAALVELRAQFDLKGKQLLELDDAGVPDSVVDLMVALSYPEKFVVEHPVSGAPAYGFGDDIGYPFDRFDAFGGWSLYSDALFWPTYYSPFAYRYWGIYDPYFVPGSGYVVIGAPHPGSGGGEGEPVRSGVGRVVDGRGYTRITTRTPEPTARQGFGNDGTSSTSSAGSSGGNSNSGGSSGVSSGGYSGGGDTGRTAIPRPPGN